MKKIYVLGVLLLASVGVSAETVSSVSFNPSRLGSYEHLKVSGGARLQGGLKAKDLNVVSKQASTSQTAQEEGVAGVVSLFYPSTLPSNTTMFSLDKVTGVSDRPYIYMPSAIFHKKGTSSVSNFDAINSNTTPAGNIRTRVLMSGGSLSFSGGNDGDKSDSFIGTLQANNNLLQFANKVNAGTVNVAGSPEVDVPLLGSSEGADGGSTQLLQMGGVNIPYPNVDSVRHRRAGGSSADAAAFTDFSDASMANCQLSWVTRRVTPQTEHSNLSNLNVRVLGLAGNCPLSCVESDPVTNWEYSDDWRHNYNCPAGKYGKAKRVIATKTVCNSSGEAETTTYYPNGTDWDTSDCKDNPKWTYVEGSMERNTYQSHWAWTDNGYNEMYWNVFCWCWKKAYHVDGVDETRCYYNSSKRLWIGDTISILSGYSDFMAHIAGMGTLLVLPVTWDEYWDAYFGTNITFHRLLKNWVGGDHSHKVRTGDRIQNAPTCTVSLANSSNNEIWEEIYYLQPHITIGWPVTCNGWGYRVKYKCM